MSTALTGPQVVFALEAVHAVTGTPLSPLAAVLLAPIWNAWRVLIRGHAVVVTADASDLAGMPPKTVIQVSVLRASLAGVLANQGVTSITLHRPRTLKPVAPGARTQRLAIDPAAGQLELHLCDEHGLALSKRTVAAVSVAGATESSTVALTERTSGVYRSAGQVWGPTLHPFAVQVDGVTVATRVIDYEQPTTRLRLVVPSHHFTR